jgi:hypothetical protein
MGVKVAINFPNTAKGTEMDVGGVLVKNGGSVELDDDQELSFVARHRKPVKEWAGDSEYVKVTGTPKYGDKAVEEMFPQPEPAEIVPDQSVEPAESAEEGANS